MSGQAFQEAIGMKKSRIATIATLTSIALVLFVGVAFAIEYIGNGGFENGYTGWTRIGSGTYDHELQGDITHTGNLALYMIAPAGSLVGIQSDPPIYLYPGEPVTISVWAWGGNGWAIVLVDNNTQAQSCFTSLNGEDSWTHYVCSFVPPNNSYYLYIGTWNTYGDDGYIDDITLSSYTPPEVHGPGWVDAVTGLADWQQWTFIALSCFMAAMVDSALAPIPALVAIFAHDARGAQFTLVILPFYYVYKFVQKGRK